ARAHAREAVAEAHEGIEPPVHPGAEGVLAADEGAGAVGLVLADGERAQAAQEALRAEGPTRFGVAAAIADLGHAPDVGAELAREVVVLAERGEMARLVRVPGVEAVAGQRLPRPLRGQVGAGGREAAAEEELAGEDVRAGRPPLEVGTQDAVEPAALDLAV